MGLNLLKLKSNASGFPIS